MKITKYSDILFEGVSDFLKAQYNNIFNDANKQLNNLFVDFNKKLETEKDISNLYQRFIKSNQTTVQNEINNAETIDAVNKVIIDNIKYFYFSLKPVINKLQNSEFTIEKIFEKSRDKRLRKLMTYPEDQFSNAVQQYVSEAVLPEIKKDSGLDKEQQTIDQTQQPNPQPANEMMRNIYKILEADEPAAEPVAQPETQQPQTNPDDDLIKYKKSAIKWINLSLFDLLKPKFTLLNGLGNNTGIVDELSGMMKGTNNENAKKMILNKIVNMDKEGLQNLANFVGLTENELGQL